MLALAELVVVAVAAAVLGSWFSTRAVRSWYATAAKPRGTPPASSFNPLWVALHFFLAVAAWKVWLVRGWGGAPVAFEFFFAQIALGVIWAVFFFELRRTAIALAVMVALWLAVFAAALAFSKVSALAGFLEWMYLAWVSYVMLLNVGFLRLNRVAEGPRA